MQWITNSFVIYTITGLLIASAVFAGDITEKSLQSSSEPSELSSTDFSSHSTNEETSVSSGKGVSPAADDRATEASSKSENTSSLDDADKFLTTEPASSEHATEEYGFHNSSSAQPSITNAETPDSSRPSKEHLESENVTAIPIAETSDLTHLTKHHTSSTTGSESNLPEDTSSTQTSVNEKEMACTTCEMPMETSSKDTTTIETTIVDEFTSSYEENSNSTSRFSEENEHNETDTPKLTAALTEHDKLVKLARSTVKRSAKHRSHGESENETKLMVENFTSFDSGNQNEAVNVSSSPLKPPEDEHNNPNVNISSHVPRSEAKDGNEKLAIESNNLTHASTNSEQVSEELTDSNNSKLITSDEKTDTSLTYDKSLLNGSVSQIQPESLQYTTSASSVDTLIHAESRISNVVITNLTMTPEHLSNPTVDSGNLDKSPDKLQGLSSDETISNRDKSNAIPVFETTAAYHIDTSSTRLYASSESSTKGIDVGFTTSITDSKENQATEIRNTSKESVSRMGELVMPIDHLSPGSGFTSETAPVEFYSNEKQTPTDTRETPLKKPTENGVSQLKQTMPQTTPSYHDEKNNRKSEVSTLPSLSVNPSLTSNIPEHSADNIFGESSPKPTTISASQDHTRLSVQSLSAVSSIDDVMLNDSPPESTATVEDALLIKKVEDRKVDPALHSKDAGVSQSNSMYSTAKPQNPSSSEQTKHIAQADTSTNVDIQEHVLQLNPARTIIVETTTNQAVSNSYQTIPVVLLEENAEHSPDTEVSPASSNSNKPLTESNTQSGPLLQNVSDSSKTEVPVKLEDSNNKTPKPEIIIGANSGNFSTDHTVPETTTSPVAELSNTSTSPMPTTKKSFAIRKPKLKSSGDDGLQSMFALRRPTTTTTKRPVTSGVSAPVSIFGRSRTRRPSITSSTTHRAFVRPATYRVPQGPVRIVGTETFPFSLPQTTLPPTTTEAEEEEEEEEDVVELQEEPSENETFSEDEDLVLQIFSASTVVEKGIRWKKQLHSRPSPEYKKQEQRMHRALERIFRSSPLGPNLWKVKIDGFIEKYPGSRSVEVDYFVYLVKTDEPFQNTELIRAFTEQLTNNSFSRYTFNPAYTQFQMLREEKLLKPTEAPEVEPPIPQWAIAVIVVGTASFIFIVLFAAVTVYGRHHMKRRYSSKLDDDLERSDDSRDWERKLGASGAYENLAADVVYDADDSFGENGKRKYVPPNPPRNPRMKHYDSWRTEWTEPPKRARAAISQVLF